MCNVTQLLGTDQYYVIAYVMLTEHDDMFLGLKEQCPPADT